MGQYYGSCAPVKIPDDSGGNEEQLELVTTGYGSNQGLLVAVYNFQRDEWREVDPANAPVYSRVSKVCPSLRV